MKPLYDFSALPVDRTISAQDTMLATGLETQYYDIGQRALELVKFSAELCDKPHYPDILDLPCGYGRVLRWLRANYNYARITACDLERGGVDFCAERFGALPVYSKPNLRELDFGKKFDLIWVGSLLTHLPHAAWLDALDCFVNWTNDCGVIVLSVQGRFFASQIARGQKNIVDNVHKEPLLADFVRDGFGYQPYFEEKEGKYGIALTSPEWIGRTLQRYPNLIMRSYLEQAWGMQDIVILYKRDGFYEPLLGTSELNRAAPAAAAPKSGGFLSGLLGR